jgi:hypothetical protein
VLSAVLLLILVAFADGLKLGPRVRKSRRRICSFGEGRESIAKTDSFR